MATKRISELPAKGSTIGATDLVEISEPDGLGGYVSKRVTGAQLGSDTNIYNTDGTLTGNRVVNMGGNNLQFDNGQMSIGNTIGSPYLMEVNGTGEGKRGLYVESSGLIAIAATDLGNVALSALTQFGFGVYGRSVGSGNGGVFETSTGLASQHIGKVLIEPTMSGVNSASAAFEVNSTTQGALLPRMTTAQRDAIATPATGLEIYNTDTDRKEFYNGSYWRGDTVDIQLQANQSSPTASTTTYFGYLAAQPTATAQNRRMFIRKDGVIRFAEIYSRANTAGDNTNWSLYVRLNDTTDYLIQTVGVSANERIWTNSSLNIPVVAGDYVEIKMVNPAWGTAPANITFAGRLTIE